MSEHEFSSEPVTKTAAIAALAKASFYSEDEDRFLTHSFRGFCGADWDFMAGARLIEEADSVMWVDGFAGHELEVRVTKPDFTGREREYVYCFQATRPAVVAS